jgi:hypothetical protein
MAKYICAGVLASYAYIQHLEKLSPIPSPADLAKGSVITDVTPVLTRALIISENIYALAQDTRYSKNKNFLDAGLRYNSVILCRVGHFLGHRNRDACTIAGDRGNLRALKWAVARGYPYGDLADSDRIHFGDERILQYVQTLRGE